MHFRFLLPVALVLAAVPAAARMPKPAEVANPAITPAEIKAHVRYLASPELKGRGSGTPEADRAAEYIAARFKAVGLKPMGDAAGKARSYFQKFSVFTGVRLGSGNELVFKGPGGGSPIPVQSEFMPLAFTRNGRAEAPLVFAGYGITAPAMQYDDYAGLEVRGKVVLVLRNTPDGDLNGKFAAHATLLRKVMNARDHGAAAILLLTGPGSDQPENLGIFDADSASTDSGIPAAIVKRNHVERLMTAAGRDLKELQVTMAHGKPASFALEGVTATIHTHVERQSSPTRNVIGYLEGTDPKLRDEVVVIGAHYDHLGLGGSHSLAQSAGPAVHHGADDNASGTAGVLELAQHFAANRKQLGRSLLFMAFSGEEIGLLGSMHWVKNPTLPLKRVAAMINLDMIGRAKNDSFFVIGSGTSTAWPKLLENVNNSLKMQAKLGEKDGFGGSDHQSFYNQNIPVLFFFTGVHADYHRPSDTWEKVNAEGQARLLRFVAETARRTSKLPQRPAVVKGSALQQSQPSGGFRVVLGTVPSYEGGVEGVLLADVRPGGPADKGGVKAGDIIVMFDGKTIRNVQEYTAVLGTAVPDQTIELVVLRKGERVTLKVTPVAPGRR